MLLPLSLLGGVTLGTASPHATPPPLSNPPTFPPSVSLFTPASDPTLIQDTVNSAYSSNGGSPLDPTTTCNNGQFSDSRFAFLFTPGTYDVDVPVGYYTSVYGLGESPYDTTFTAGKGVYAEQGCADFSVGALDTFWRSAENFRTTVATAWAVGTGMSWAVSQAAPLRNVVVDNDLLLFEYVPTECCAAGFASGGWGSGLSVGGAITFGSQQQWMIRNSKAGEYASAVWNTVFAGVPNAPEDQCGSTNTSSTTTQETLPVTAEKPYITADEKGDRFTLIIPNVVTDSAGVPYDKEGMIGGAIERDFEQVYVTDPDKDTSTTINAALAAGYDLVISPGIYTLDASITVTNPSQVVLGLGFATLVAPSNGDPCVAVSPSATNARIAGLLLEAGPHATTSMLVVDGAGAVLTDVFVRVGGPTTGVGPVDTMMTVNSDDVVVDNTWLWRADHYLNPDPEGPDLLVKNGDNAVTNGFVVNGDGVRAYGLAVEHTIEDNVLWNGEDGVTVFFQAEIMYDFEGKDWGHSCYKIDGAVNRHEASGVGCYSFFRDDDEAFATSGFDTGGNGVKKGGVEFHNAVSVKLNGGGGILNVIDSDGESVSENGHTARNCGV